MLTRGPLLHLLEDHVPDQMHEGGHLHVVISVPDDDQGDGRLCEDVRLLPCLGHDLAMTMPYCRK